MATYDPTNLNEHINLNITHLAQKVLDSDRLIFGTIQGKGLSFGTLVNTIISSYDNDFPLTESLRVYPFLKTRYRSTGRSFCKDSSAAYTSK